MHGHQGRTELVVHDFEPLSHRPRKEGGRQFELMVAIVDQSAFLATLAGDGEFEPDTAELQRGFADLRRLIDEFEKSFTEPLSRAG